jgi:hypothetical protein
MALVVLPGTPATTIMQAASKGAVCFFSGEFVPKRAEEKLSAIRRRSLRRRRGDLMPDLHD